MVNIEASSYASITLTRDDSNTSCDDITSPIYFYDAFEYSGELPTVPVVIIVAACSVETETFTPFMQCGPYHRELGEWGFSSLQSDEDVG